MQGKKSLIFLKYNLNLRPKSYKQQIFSNVVKTQGTTKYFLLYLKYNTQYIFKIKSFRFLFIYQEYKLYYVFKIKRAKYKIQFIFKLKFNKHLLIHLKYKKQYVFKTKVAKHKV